MKLIEGTKVKHISFGEGIFKEYQGDNLVIVFDTCGRKLLSSEIMSNGKLSIPGGLDTKDDNSVSMGESVQAHLAKEVIGNCNIFVPKNDNKKIIFDESFVVVGATLRSPEVYACYDLTVIGDVDVESIDVKGDLTVIGDLRASQISCSKQLICKGDITANTISVGGSVYTENITCATCSCADDIFIKTTLDISHDVNCERSVIAGEGIVGSGDFSVKNAVAVEYFEFDGNMKGKIVELDLNVSYGENQEKDRTLSDIYTELIEEIDRSLLKAGDVDEDSLIECVHQIANLDEKKLYNWHYLYQYIIDISYLNRINNLRDYLFVVAAQKILPIELQQYETVSHVFSKLLPECVDCVDSLEFKADNLEELVTSITIALTYTEIDLDKTIVLDHIFQSIGLKYKTVKSFLDK